MLKHFLFKQTICKVVNRINVTGVILNTAQIFIHASRGTVKHYYF